MARPRLFDNSQNSPDEPQETASKISLEYFVANNQEIRAMGKGLPDYFKAWIRLKCPEHLGKEKAEGDWKKLYEKYIKS